MELHLGDTVGMMSASLMASHSSSHHQCCGVGVDAGVGVGWSRLFWQESESESIKKVLAGVEVGVD